MNGWIIYEAYENCRECSERRKLIQAIFMEIESNGCHLLHISANMNSEFLSVRNFVLFFLQFSSLKRTFASVTALTRNRRNRRYLNYEKFDKKNICKLRRYVMLTLCGIKLWGFFKICLLEKNSRVWIFYDKKIY